jgi:hypothetical protein
VVTPRPALSWRRAHARTPRAAPRAALRAQIRLAIYIKGTVKRCTDVPAALRDAVALCREARAHMI